MALFQTVVLNKHLQNQYAADWQEKWIAYKKHFLNPAVQQNISNAKEEQYQEGFIADLFVQVLGYTKYPNPNYTITTEQKNQKDSKKADAAIIIQQEVRAVIELKGTNTADLNKIEGQAFGYKHNHPNCHYVIISNFEKLRLYIDNAIEFMEFNLFGLSEREFQTLYLLLNYQSIAADIPRQIKRESLHAEEQISQQLYKDYAQFKHDLFHNLCQNNPQQAPLLLFKLSQKIIDKFLFLFFAEDRQLLPPNSIKNILQQWKNMKDWGYYTPLYDHYKKYFGFLHQGTKNESIEVFAYNGGLFLPDPTLDQLLIDDQVLWQHTQKLSDYDFGSEVDVNILGHIFENSLNDIDEMNAQLQGQSFDKSQTKRKKDGIFYTPRYITKYIVDNTVGRLCSEQKQRYEIDESRFAKDPNRSQKEKKQCIEQLKQYREWLLQLTICDPACGSGAFLNEALSFLIQEHAYIDQLQANLFGDRLLLTDVESSILENNLYGVDINEESVEIAKLALWLRTAKPRRKLNTLSNNIQCGNSLVDDPLASDKAFDWQAVFPKVFERGGFDVIIGNPPYVQLQSMKESSAILEQKGYQTFERTGDLYCLFYEKGNQLLRSNGLLGFITSNKWMRAGYGKSLRQYLLTHTQILLLVDVGAGIFSSATVDSNLLFFEKKADPSNTSIPAIDISQEKNFTDLEQYKHRQLQLSLTAEQPWVMSNAIAQQIKQKIDSRGVPLKKWDVHMYRGILTGFNDAFVIDQSTKDRLCAEDPNSERIIKPLLRGRDIQRYCPEWQHLWLIGTFPALKLNIDDFPAIKNYLMPFAKQLEQSGEKGSRKKTANSWFETQDAIAYFEEFEKYKIIYPNMTLYLPFMYDETGFHINDKAFIITALKDVNLKFLLAFLNAKLAKMWIRDNCPELQGGTREIRKVFFENIPIPLLSDSEQQPFIVCADRMLALYGDFQRERVLMERSLLREFHLSALSNRLQQWYSLSFGDFLKALEQQKVKLSLLQKAEWEPFFVAQQQKIATIQQQIEQTDRQIDAMVYALYGLTDEEIAFVEQ